MPESSEVQPEAKAPCQALEPFLPFCWGFWHTEDFGPMEDLESIHRARSWVGLFLLEEEDLLHKPAVG